jgi:FAD/FMN-containing dehydrogenase
MILSDLRDISNPNTLRNRLSTQLKVEVSDDAEILKKYSRDTSIFERTPRVVVYPRNADEVSAILRFVYDAKSRGENVSIAARSAGTDMSGGPLTDSIAMVFSKYMNRILSTDTDVAEAEPGVYYRDFEKATVAHNGQILPSFPASREICALGGMISNNSGGELTLEYGKTNRYTRELNVVLSDGSQTIFKPLSQSELAEKESHQDLEGSIYREIHALLQNNGEEIEKARPTVTKNSAGYALWNVHNKEKGTFDLTQLIAGSQGTLAFVTKAKLGLVHKKPHRAMLVVFLSDIEILPEIVHRVLKFNPESFESYDDQTFKLAVRFIPQIIGHFGIVQMIRLGIAFIPEMLTVVSGGVPKLVLMAEFSAETHDEALFQAEAAGKELHGLAVSTQIAKSETQAAKYWTIRRESFALLRKNLKGLYASPFIDDIVVHPDDYPKFLPELNQILNNYKLIYTIAGHAGEGNFHIIPLMDLNKPESRRAIMELQPKVYELVAKYHGSIDGEHNDGIVRTPYLHIMFGQKMCNLFEQVKYIFDPLNILNPGKKVGGTIADIERSILTSR